MSRIGKKPIPIPEKVKEIDKLIVYDGNQMALKMSPIRIEYTYEGETGETLGSLDLSETISNTAVKSWGSLHSALDDIEWAHDGVGDSAREDTSHHAFLVVTHVVNV